MKHDVTHTRWFNLEHAKEGAPFCCRNGVKAALYNTNSKNKNYPLVGELLELGEPHAWSIVGETYGKLDAEKDEYDLVMLPLGICEGFPVYTNDFLYTKISDQGFSMSYWLDVDKEISEMSWKPFVEKENFQLLTNFELFEQYYKYEKICCIAENENFYTTLYNNIPKHIALSIWQAAIASLNTEKE